MSWGDHLNILRFVVLPVIVSALVVSLALTVVFRCLHKTREATASSVFIFVFGLLGAIAGVCTGASRQPVVGTILPAILTLLTAILGYAFTREGLAAMRPVIPFCLIALLLNALYCAFVGSKIRFENEVYAASIQRDLLSFERVELEVEKAKRLRDAGVPAASGANQTATITVEPPKPDLPPVKSGPPP